MNKLKALWLIIYNSVYILVYAASFILFVAALSIVASGRAHACNDAITYQHRVLTREHMYFQVHAGKQGNWLTAKGSDTDNWEGEEAIAAVFRLGYKQPLYEKWLWGGIEVEHHSHWDKGWPHDDNGESELDYAGIYLEFVLDPFTK